MPEYCDGTCSSVRNACYYPLSTYIIHHMYTYITHSLRILSTPFLTNIRARAYTKTLELFEIKRGTQIAMDSKLCNRVRRSLQGHDQQHEHLCLCVHARSVPFIVCLLLKDHGCPQNRSTLWRVGHRVMQRLSPDRAQDPPLRALFPNKALSLPPSLCLRVSLSLSLSLAGHTMSWLKRRAVPTTISS